MENETNMKNSMLLLVKSIEKLMKDETSLITAIPGLSLFRKTETTSQLVGMYRPSICLIAQGAKKVYLRNDTFFYDETHYLFSGLNLPVSAEVVRANKEKPYLALALILDFDEISKIIAENKLPSPPSDTTERGMATGTITLPLINAFQRLLDLLESKQDIPVLSQVIQKEIFYRLLVGEQGKKLRQLSLVGSKSQLLSEAINWIKTNFAKKIHIEDLADMAEMGVSTFHHHFRNMTALSPLQFQKMMRLQEARRLMLAERVDAAVAAFHVGYESPSQFSREYKRLYGLSPVQDITSLRQETIGATQKEN